MSKTTLLWKKSNTTYVVVVEKQERVSMAFHLEVEGEGQYVGVLCFIFSVLFLIRQINRYFILHTAQAKHSDRSGYAADNKSESLTPRGIHTV